MLVQIGGQEGDHHEGCLKGQDLLIQQSIYGWLFNEINQNLTQNLKKMARTTIRRKVETC